jgi:hypothetical protein
MSIIAGSSNSAVRKQHEPKNMGGEDVYPHVISDIADRVIYGRMQYRTTLQTNNGRDALVDAYQEAIDLVLYLRQAILERDSVVK